jgi:hypothetical protein
MTDRAGIVPLTGSPLSEVIVQVGGGTLLAGYDRRGRLRLLRRAPAAGRRPGKPAPAETVLRIRDIATGESTFKSAASHCGFSSVNGYVYWSTIWDDDRGGPVKACTFQEWVDECAEVLAEVKDTIAVP